MAILTIDRSTPEAHAPAIQWAAQRLQATGFETITCTNWSATYRLTGEGTVGYLKLLPGEQKAQAERIRSLAQAFSEAVPEVLAVQPDAGWILMADHGGHESDYSDEQIAAVAAAYARLQTAAATQPALLRSWRRVDLSSCVDELLTFLGADPTASGAQAPQATAAQFIGQTDAQRYLELIGTRADRLRRHVMRAAQLRPTVCHGDLHMENIGLRDDGSIVFVDWDELAVGPAGLSLQGLLSGCTKGTLALARMANGSDTGTSTESVTLGAYLQALVDGGYASKTDLLEALPGALCAGQVRFIASFGQYPGTQNPDTVRSILIRRLSDLLDLCDWLSSVDEATALAQAEDYASRGEHRRAHRLVTDQLSRQPQRIDLLVRYAQGALALGDKGSACEALEAALEIDGSDIDIRRQLVRLLLERQQLSQALEVLRAHATHGQLPADLLAWSERIPVWIEVQREADRPGGLPRVALTDAERSSGQLSSETRLFVAHLFRQTGAVQVDNVFSAEMVTELQQAFAKQQEAYLAHPDREDVLPVGDRRYMLTMALEGIYGASSFVASGLYLPIMREVLGQDCILSAYTAVVSMPGSADQEVHKDHTPLFEESGWPLDMPSFAAQVIVPLLELNPITGATRIVPGSQRVVMGDDIDAMPVHDPVVPLGSCMLLDYSVAHYGKGNRSDQVRPIINLIYSRPWFRDCRNYHRQPPLRFSEAFFDQAPQEVKSLVAWWQLERRAAIESAA